VIPTSVFLLAFDAALFGGVCFEDVQAHVAEDGEVFRSVTGSDTALVFAEVDIELPVKLVFDAPMTAGGARKRLGLGRDAAKIEAPLAGGLAFDRAH